jgi:tetratricopeptide (TPR) repeat protein
MATLLRNRPSSPPPRVDFVEQRLSDADLAIEQERYMDALRFVEEILAVRPDNKKALEMKMLAEEGSAWAQAQDTMRKGRMEQRRGEYDLARQYYEEAIEIDEKNVDARHMLAELLLETKNDLQRALKLAKEVIVMGGQRARYFATLGELLLLADEAERAAQAFEKALTLEPDNKNYKKLLKQCKK